MPDRENRRQQIYVGAPYNFIPFYNDVVSVEQEQMNIRGSFHKELFTGEISYTLTAKTPICIDDGTGNFFKNENNETAIPGSSMRGLIRNNAQILGLSSFDDDIDDYTLMYRDVTGGVDKKSYEKILAAEPVTIGNNQFSVLKNVSSGYITCEKGKYYIYKTAIDSLGDDFVCMNYYIISARNILENLKRYPFFKKNRDCLMYRLDCEFVRVVTFEGIVDNKRTMRFSYETETGPEGLAKDKEFYYCGTLNENNIIIIEKFSKQPITDGQRVQCSSTPIIHYIPKDKTKGENFQYIPFYEKVLYKISNNRFVDSIKMYNASNTEGYAEGYLIGTGFIKEKKALYIIPKIDKQKERIEIQEQDVKAYQVDYKKRQSTLASKIKDPHLKEQLSLKIKEFFQLPKEGEIKPVFYIEPNQKNTINRLYFGYTPNLRLLYSHSVKKGYHQNEITYDYVRSIFGTAEDRDKMSEHSNGKEKQETRKAYRSKVSFTDAVLNGKINYNKSYKLRLEEPKPSSFYDYIEQQEEVTTYNNNNFNLRGVKQYWLSNSLHQLPDNAEINQDTKNYQNAENDQIGTHLPFTALEKNSVFKGAVRFQNLSKAELGLLLWSIRLQENSCMNIGKAKAYGFGVIAVSDIKVKVVNLDEAYSLDTPLSLNPFIDKDVDELIDSYKDTINKKLNGPTIDQLEHIQDFCAMKDYKNLPNQQAIKFMSITNNGGEYKKRQNRRIPLATVQKVLNNQQAKAVKKKSSDQNGVNNSVYTEFHIAPQKSRQSEKKHLENERMYIAKVIRYQGKKVHFKIANEYYDISIDNIQNIQNLTKKTVKALLPVHSEWNIKKHMNGEQETWNFEAK